MEITNMSGYTYKFNSSLLEATEFDYTFNFICNNEKYTRILFSPTDALLYFKENGDIIPALTILDGVYEWVDTSYMTFDIIDGEDANNVEAIQTLSLYGEFILTQDEQDITISGKYKWNNTLQMPTNELIFKNFIANNKKFTENVSINNTNDVCSVVVSNTGECLYFNDKGWLDGSLTYSQLLAGSDGISSDIYQIWDFGNGVTIKLKAYKYLIANANVYNEEQETKQVVMTLKNGLVLETLNNELFLLQQSNYDVDLPIKFNLYSQGVLINSFEFEYNMTWQEFINSKYNIDNKFYVKENDDKVYYIRDNYVIENQTKDFLVLEQDYNLLELEPPAEDDEPIIPEEPEIPDEPTTPTKLNFVMKVDGAFDGVYSFEEGMNWLQFIESEYNANGLFSIKNDDNYVYYREEFIIKNVIYTSIIENKEYDTFKETIDTPDVPEKPDIPSDSIVRLKKLMSNIANSIRYKTNSNKSINAQKFSDEILDIKTDIEVSGTLEITKNGNYDVSTYVNANVNVPVPEGYLDPEGTQEITANGGYNVEAVEWVDVNVQPKLQEKTAIENGEVVADSGYDGLSKVNVNVPNIINGVPIEIPSLDNALLVAENEGKVYKYDGKLYRVVPDLENITYTSLEGATVTVPSGWSASSDFLYVTLEGSINVYGSSSNLYIGSGSNFYIGYSVSNDSIVKSDDRIVYQYSLLYKNSVSSSYSFSLTITGGPSVTNQKLIQWFIDNNATIEGGEYVAGFIFQEILSPSGTLDVTANGEVDVKSYEKVNVSIPEVPYFDGTIEITGGLISFTINGTSYNTEEGMNWYEWCSSSYNTSDCTCAGLNHNVLNSVGNLLYYNGNVYPYGQDLIIKDTAYSVSTFGGGSN